MDAQWNDEFHHALVSYLTKADRGFLARFGGLAEIQKVLSKVSCMTETIRPIAGAGSGVLRRIWREKNSWFSFRIMTRWPIPIRDHDYRELVSPDQFKLAITLLLCSPYLPLLFMGQEFAETAPFLYFTSHIDAALAKMVTEGRRREYSRVRAVGGIFRPPGARYI